MKFLIPLILIACTFSCRSTHHERTENVRTSLADTAHFAHVFSTTSDSTATFTWLAIDTLDVWLAQPDSAPALQNATPHTAQLRARNLRLVRSETRSATRQDSVRSQSQSIQSTTSQVSDAQQAKPSRSLTFTLTILNLIALAVLAIALYFFRRYIKQRN